MANAHEKFGADPWKDFGDWGSGSAAKGAGSAWNSVSIDMSQYTGLILRIKPGDTFTASAGNGIGISFQRTSSSAGRKIQWGAIQGAASSMQEFDTELIANTLVPNEETYFVFDGAAGFNLLGMDDICISLKNQEGGSRTMESVEYRRTGFKPMG
jgi:hypothetical protein